MTQFKGNFMVEQISDASCKPTRKKAIKAKVNSINSTEYNNLASIKYWHLFKERLWRVKRKKAPYKINDRYIKNYFAQEDCLKKQCEFLTRYLIEAFDHYAISDYTLAYYPGKPSRGNAKTDATESISRILPLLAAWLHHSKEREIETLNGNHIDCVAIIKSVFLSKTHPLPANNWDKLDNFDPRISEISDFALALWLSKKQIWQTLTCDEQKQIITWLQQVNHVFITDNKCHLSLLIVQCVIKDLTDQNFICQQKYQQIKDFYVGQGWFKNDAQGHYDYETAWGFHYHLYWIDKICPDFDPSFIHQSLSDLIQNYRYFFTSEGFPFFGQNASYRLAAPAPLLAAIDQGASNISIGQAKRAFRTNLSYFIANGAMKFGAPTQGLFDSDERLIDNNCGPTGGFCSFRSLIIALYSGNKNGLWHAKEMPLDIELASFNFDIPAIHAHIRGNKKTNEVIVIFEDNNTKEQNILSRRLLPTPWLNKIKEKLFAQAYRPENNLLKKGVTCYSSKLTHFI